MSIKHENEVILGDCRSVLNDLDDNSIDICITSPPYWGCRDYCIDNQIGIENDPFEYISELKKIFSIVKKKLKEKGNLYIVIDDVWVSNWTRGRKNTWVSSKGNEEGISSEKLDYMAIQRNWPKKLCKSWLKAKQKLLLPERLIIKMQEEDEWIFREKIIWYKTNAGNYTNVKDRLAHAYEYILHFTKNQYYYANMKALIDENSGKMQRDVLFIPIERSDNQHSAIFPKLLVKTLMDFSCPSNGILLDPFCGTGTALVVAKSLGNSYIGIELSPIYQQIALKRLLKTKKLKTSRYVKII